MARIGQSVATPTSEDKASSKVKLCYTPPAILAVCVRYAAEPRATTAKMARRPRDRHALLYRLPFGVSPASRAVHQNHGVCFSAGLDAAERFSTEGPRTRERVARVQPSLTIPAAHIDRDAGLNEAAGAAVKRQSQ
jgi:hypothetical protein